MMTTLADRHKRHAAQSPPAIERHIFPTRIQQGLARPEGSERALPTFVIEGVAELVEALRAA